MKRALRPTGILAILLLLSAFFVRAAIGDGYKPEQTEAQYRLLSAIQAGLESAMYKFGYDEPYIAETRLAAEGVRVAVYAACDQLHQSTGSREGAAGCFLYMLSVEDQPPSLDNDAEWSPQYKNNLHFVYIHDFFDKNALKPKKIATVRRGKEIIVELTSYAENSAENLRRDYFSSDGTYLGSDKQDWKPDYFYNYRLASESSLSMIFDRQGLKVLEETVINTFPYEAFALHEMVRKRTLHALDKIVELPSKPFEFAPVLDSQEKRDTAVEYYIFRYGQHPSRSQNAVSPENMEKFSDGIVWHEAIKGQGFQKVMAKDRWRAERLVEYYINPLNAEYDPYKADHIAFKKNGKEYFTGDTYSRLGYRNYGEAPYVARTTVWPAGTEVRFLSLCLGSGNENQHKNWDNRCFAYRMSLTNNGKTYHHFVLNTEMFNPVKSPTQTRWSGTSWPAVSLDTIHDGLRVIVLTNVPVNNCTDTGCWRKDFFSTDGQYIGSYNRLFSEGMVYKYKPMTGPLVLDTHGDVHLYMNTSPTIRRGYSTFPPQ